MLNKYIIDHSTVPQKKLIKKVINPTIPLAFLRFNILL